MSDSKDNNSGFGDWLAENEVKSDWAGFGPATGENLRPGADDEAFTPAYKDNHGGIRKAKWDREDSSLFECKSCRGTGVWHPTYLGGRARPGVCFKCQGRGFFKTSDEQRAKARVQRNASKLNKLEQAKQDFEEQNPGLAEFLAEAGKWSDFAASLSDQFQRKGFLSEKQIGSAARMRTKCEAREAGKKAKQQETAAAAPEGEVDLTGIPSGYYAVPDGDTRLKVRINRPGKQSNWHGWTFVSDGAAYGQRQNYGRQGPGKLYSGKIIPQLKAIAADPESASKAYGKLVGVCGVCGRKLEDETSVANGIGPVCAEKMGW